MEPPNSISWRFTPFGDTFWGSPFQLGRSQVIKVLRELYLKFAWPTKKHTLDSGIPMNKHA